MKKKAIIWVITLMFISVIIIGYKFIKVTEPSTVNASQSSQEPLSTPRRDTSVEQEEQYYKKLFENQQ